MRKLFFVPLLLSTVLSAEPAPAPLAAKAAIRSGPMLGYADLTEASVWVQTTSDTQVRLRYWPEGKRGESRTTGTLSADEKTDRPALFVSRASTRDAVRIRDPDRWPAPAFRRGERRDLRHAEVLAVPHEPSGLHVAFGSCYYANEPAMDRPGTRTARIRRSSGRSRR